jgi:8-oxo-dGTP pyrophosphatase MutT (NUDIX family)
MWARRGFGHPARIAAVSEDIRKAASVIAVRDAEEGPEVLVLERSSGSRFLPGYVVFPGGAVDADDERLAQAWFGSAAEAARAAAVRELAEEAGLALTATGLEVADPGDPMAAAAASPPARDQLTEVAHWVAPEEVPVRYDARYYAVASPPGLDPVPDGHEAVNAWWVAPYALLGEWEAGARKLYWPTYFTVRALVASNSADELRARRIETREPDDADLDRLPRSVFWQD